MLSNHSAGILNVYRILSRDTEDFRFSSPFMVPVAGEPTGVLTGHQAVRACRSRALARLPDLHFTLVDVFTGLGSIVIHCCRHDGGFAAEHFEFDVDGKATRSSAHYSA